MPLQESSNRALKPEYAGYTKVQLAVDSGAAASVMPEGLVSTHPAQQGDASRNGEHYSAADGGRIPYLGEVELGFMKEVPLSDARRRWHAPWVHYRISHNSDANSTISAHSEAQVV